MKSILSFTISCIIHLGRFKGSRLYSKICESNDMETLDRKCWIWTIKGKVFGNLFGSHSNLTLQQNLLLQLKTVSLWEPSLQISSKSYTKENYNK